MKNFLKLLIFQVLQRLVRVRPRVVFFEAYQGKSYACSPKAIYEYMSGNSDFKDWLFVWSFRNPKDHLPLGQRRNTIVVKKYRLQYFVWIARAKFWIVNSIQPYHLVKKKDQIMVQCWHGTPLKRLRNDLFQDYASATNTHKDMIRKNDRDTSRFDFLLSPSPYCSQVFSSAFNLKALGKSEILLEVGYPRNDRLKTFHPDEPGKIRQELGIPHGKKVILYAPTWRDDQHEKGLGYTLDLPIDFGYLEDRLRDEYVILFRAHYYLAQHFDFSKYKGFVYDVSRVDDVNDLYLASDVLITDYSSVFFDFANLGKPMIFFMYDLEHYRDRVRGFYLEDLDFPGDIVRSEMEICNILMDLAAYEAKHTGSYKDFVARYNPWDDGNASARFVDKVFST